jgi:hypothetical protein
MTQKQPEDKSTTGKENIRQWFSSLSFFVFISFLISIFSYTFGWVVETYIGVNPIGVYISVGVSALLLGITGLSIVSLEKILMYLNNIATNIQNITTLFIHLSKPSRHPLEGFLENTEDDITH